jgi:hypothetical protein
LRDRSPACYFTSVLWDMSEVHDMPHRSPWCWHW